MQRIRQAVDPKTNAKNDLDVLADIIAAISGKKLGGFDAVLALLVKEIPFFNSADLRALAADTNLRKAAGRLW